MHKDYKRTVLARVRRVVVKLGSRVVTTADGVDRDNVGRLVGELARLHENGLDIVVVSSGARAAGLARLGLSRIPDAIPEQQAAAAIGQIRLMMLYEEFFSSFGKHVGQVLLTAADVEDRSRYLNARHTFERLLDHRIIPVVNENDSVAIDELKFGDNDRLSALVAGLVAADLLVILTDVDGYMSDDPRRGTAELVPVLDDVDTAIARASDRPGDHGTGGIASKLRAARSAARRGIPTIIANGRLAGVLPAALDPESSVGTLIHASRTPLSSRKHWIAYGMARRGTLVLDHGAVAAVCERGSSLLPSGIVGVDGTFDAGDCVCCVDEDGREVARGLVAYDATACARIKGAQSSRIAEILGYRISDEVIHRDDLVVLSHLKRDTREEEES